MSDDHAATVRRFWEACDARDWAAFGALISPDLFYEAPRSRERIHGRDAYVRFNAEFPGDWHLRAERIVGGPDGAVSWIDFWFVDHADEEHDTGISFFTFDDAGLIATIHDFWPDPYEPPASRAHLTERF